MAGGCYPLGHFFGGEGVRYHFSMELNYILIMTIDIFAHYI